MLLFWCLLPLDDNFRFLLCLYLISNYIKTRIVMFIRTAEITANNIVVLNLMFVEYFYPIILSGKVFCLQLMILMTTELIEFSFLSSKLHLGPGIDLGLLFLDSILGMVLHYSYFHLNPQNLGAQLDIKLNSNQLFQFFINWCIR